MNLMDEKEKLQALKRILNKKYLEWQQQTQERKTITEFAAYLGFPQSTVSFWMNASRLPKDNSDIDKLAAIIGFEIYDILERKRPDENLYYLQRNWEDYPVELRRLLRETAEKYGKKKK